MCVPQYSDNNISVDSIEELDDEIEDQYQQDEDTVDSSPPLSMEGPTIMDMERTSELKRCLVQSGVFASQAEMRHREEVVGSLQRLLRQWIRGVALSKHIPAIVADALGGNIYTFGSYRLGVQHKGATIKALCVAPRCIGRMDFFQAFLNLLKQQPQVKDIRTSVEEFGLVITMNIDSIRTDLYFARLALAEIPASLDLCEDRLLKKSDRRSVHAMSGCRVTDEILRLVPDIDHFRLTLRVIRLWAKRRGIYSTSLGYLGGTSWAILVAYICQLYPNALPSSLVHKFFHVLSQWKWPQPVMLKRQNVVSLGFRVWDPTTRAADVSDLMPIITPSYPQRNTSANISATTRTIIMEEFRLGLAMTEEIRSGRCGWARLLEAGAFFSRYQHYLVLLASAAFTQPRRWTELVEADIRLLKSMLDRNEQIKIAHVNPECYKFVLHQPNAGHPPGPSNLATQIESNDKGAASGVCYTWVIGLSLGQHDDRVVDLTREVAHFTDSALLNARFTGVHQDAVVAEVHHVRREHLHEYLSPSVLNREQTSSARIRGLDSKPVSVPHIMTQHHPASTTDGASVLPSEEAHSRPEHRRRTRVYLTQGQRHNPAEDLRDRDRRRRRV